jgi:hypothetical protein
VFGCFALRDTCPFGQLTLSTGAPKIGAWAKQCLPRTPDQRVFYRRLKDAGAATAGRVREVCETVVVSAHGGLLHMTNEVDNGEMIVVENPLTMEELECRVVFVGEAGTGASGSGSSF